MRGNKKTRRWDQPCQSWLISFKLRLRWRFRNSLAILRWKCNINICRQQYTLSLLFRLKRLVETSQTGLFAVPKTQRLWRTADRTAVAVLHRPWEFLVPIGLSPVESRSFCSLETGPPSTTPYQADPSTARRGTATSPGAGRALGDYKH